MPRKDYNQLLTNLTNRRTEFDEYGAFQKSILTESFNRKDLPETVRYVYESMQEVPVEYTEKTKSEAQRVQNQITDGLRYSGGVITTALYEYQGSVPSDTHIKVHSDLDILVIHSKFHYGVSEVVPRVGYSGDALVEMKEMRTNIFNRLSSSFPKAKVSDAKDKAIQISGGSLQRKFDILVCSWHNSQEYIQSKQSHLRGISLYDKRANSCLEDYPFLHIYEVNRKDNSALVSGNFKKLVRLLKSIKMDSDRKINLSSFLITSVLYHMDDVLYWVASNKEATLLTNAGTYLQRIISDQSFRRSLQSPNKKEMLFSSNDGEIVAEIEKLKNELDTIIADLADDFIEKRYIINESRSFEKGGGIYALTSSYDTLRNATFSY